MILILVYKLGTGTSYYGAEIINKRNKEIQFDIIAPLLSAITTFAKETLGYGERFSRIKYPPCVLRSIPLFQDLKIDLGLIYTSEFAKLVVKHVPKLVKLFINNKDKFLELKEGQRLNENLFNEQVFKIFNYVHLSKEYYVGKLDNLENKANTLEIPCVAKVT